MLGVVRVVIQVISYEVRFFFIFVYFLIVFIEREIINFLIYQYYLYIVFFILFVFYMFIISLICEISRVPFDFYEGESELVSGLNIEYNSWFFIYIYMVEYLDLVFVRFLVTYFYLGGVK